MENRPLTMEQIQKRAEEVLGVDLTNQTLADTVIMLCNEMERLEGVIRRVEAYVGLYK